MYNIRIGSIFTCYILELSGVFSFIYFSSYFTFTGITGIGVYCSLLHIIVLSFTLTDYLSLCYILFQELPIRDCSSFLKRSFINISYQVFSPFLHYKRDLSIDHQGPHHANKEVNLKKHPLSLFYKSER